MVVNLSSQMNAGGVFDMRRFQEQISQLSNQLASGNRISSAGVDTASLSISTGLKRDSAIYRAYSQGLSEAATMIQVEDGGLRNVQDILSMMMQIATHAQSGALTSAERGFLNLEFQQMLQEINRIAEETNFNGVKLLNGGFEETTTITVPAPTPGNNAPVVSNPIPNFTINEGEAFSYTLPSDTFTDPDGDFLNFMAALSGGGALPGWLSFNAGTQTFSGTPGLGDVGVVNIDVTASDAEPLSATDTFSITVNQITGSVINGTAGNDVLTGTAFNDTISGSTGTDNINAGAGDDIISVEVNTGVVPASALSVTANMVSRLDAGNTGSISGHPGVVANIADQSGSGNNANSSSGNVLSGSDTINGINALTFNGGSFLQINNSGNINTSNQTQRSVYMAFETGADVNTRQVLYEQGGGTNGFSMYIESGRLYVGAWAGNGGTFDLFTSTPIAANSTNVAGFVFDSSGAGNFRGYLNGTNFGTLANASQMPSHTGAIGIGGMNNASRFQGAGSQSGSGFAFSGKIGEFLNYDTASSPADATAIQSYLTSRWVTPVAQDTVNGGAGNDTLTLTTNQADITLDGSNISNVETISLNGNHNDHNIVVTNGATAVTGNELTLDASGSNGNITVDASGITTRQLNVLSGSGDNTVYGGGNGNTKVSYENGGATNVNLFTGTATGNGTDSLLNVNHIEGSAGNDTISGSGTADTLIGGDGNDILSDIDIPNGSVPAANRVLHLDATVTADIGGHPGGVTVIQDQSPANNDINNDTGTVTSGTDDINGLNSLRFDGSSWLGVNDSADINLSATPQRSIFTSFETGGDVNSRQVIYEEGGTVNGFNIYIENGRVYMGAYKNTGGDFDIFHSAPIAANSTYVVGSVFDSGAGTFDGYVNGAQVGTAGVGVAQAAHSGDIGVGGMNQDSRFHDGSVNGNGFGLSGEIGELLVYRDALNATEIQDLSNFLMNRRLDVEGGNDSLVGGAGSDSLTGGAGNDTLIGGADNDIAYYTGNIADYTITDNGNNTYTVTDNRVGSPDGTDLIDSVETLDFANGTVALEYNVAPTMNPGGPFSVAEDAANGTVVGTISATDANAGDTLTYSIQSGNTGGVFAIDPSTGVITVANNASLDFESITSYDLVVRATDDGSGNLFGEQNYTINVTDVADTPPPGPTTQTITTVQDTLTFQSSLNTFDTISVKINDVRTTELFTSEPDVATVASAQEAYSILQNVMDQVIGMRAQLGATQARVDNASDVAMINRANTEEARGRLADTDVAKASTEYTQRLVGYAASSLIAAQAMRLNEGLIETLLDS